MLGGNYTGLGVQRFSTPSRAWIASLQGRVEDVRSRPTSQNTDTLADFEFSGKTRSGDARLGHRWYRAVAPRVQQHITTGAFVTTSRTEFLQDDIFPQQRQRAAGGGLFAELGALWMVTRRLSLGAAWTVNASRTRSTTAVARIIDGQPASVDEETTRTGIQFGSVRMQGALYF